MDADQIVHETLELIAVHFEEPEFRDTQFTGREIAAVIRYVDAESSKAAAEVEKILAGEVPV